MPRPQWPADREAVARVRAAIDADRSVEVGDRAVAEQVLARLCWATPVFVLFLVAMLVLVVLIWALQGGFWPRSAVAGAGLVAYLGVCAWVSVRQVRLRRWRARRLPPP